MNITENLLTVNPYSRPATQLKAVKGIVVHWTGNPNSTAMGNRNFFENRKLGKDGYGSAHYIINLDGNIVRCLPESEMSYQVGSSQPYKAGSSQIYTPIAWEKLNTKGNGNQPYPNDCTIGIECCVTDMNGTMTKATYDTLVELVTYLLKKYKLTVNETFLHKEIVGWKDCHMFFVKNPAEWIKFKGLVANALSGNAQPVTQGGSIVGQVIKERIYAENGVLNRADGNYNIPATDVRYIKFEKGSYTLKLVWGQGQTVSNLVKQFGASYGFNFPYFWQGNPVADCKIGSQILNQGYDDPNGAKQTKWHGFAYKNGQPTLGMFDINDNYGADGFMVKTSPMLIENGNPCWDWYRVNDGLASDIGVDSNGNPVRAQRTFIGLDAQGNLHLAVGDGRTKWDRGLTLEEMALYMQSKGCINALNGDGGSSSVIADQSGSLGQNHGAEERAVNHAVLVFINPPKQAPTPASTPKPVVQPVTPAPAQGGINMEQWKIDMGLKALQDLQIYKQTNGDPIIDINAWKDKLDQPVQTWFFVEMMKRIMEAKK